MRWNIKLGMDVATYPEMMDFGYKYYDYEGKREICLRI